MESTLKRTARERVRCWFPPARRAAMGGSGSPWGLQESLVERGCAPSLGEGPGSTAPGLLRAVGAAGGSHSGAARAWGRGFARMQQSCQPLMTGLGFRVPLFYPQSQELLDTAGQFVGYRQSLSATPRCNMLMLGAVFAVMSWQWWDTVSWGCCINPAATVLTELQSVPPPSLCNGITACFFLL